MHRGGTRGFGRGGGKLERYPAFWGVLTSHTARGGGRGGFQQRDAGPPDTVLGTSEHFIRLFCSSTFDDRNRLIHARC